MIKGNTRTRGMMQGASRSEAIRRLQARRRYLSEQERYNDLCGPVTVTKLPESEDEDDG